MARTLTIRITEAAGQIIDQRYRLMWSARLDGVFRGAGHAFSVDEAEGFALDLVDPYEVDNVVVDYHSKEAAR